MAVTANVPLVARGRFATARTLAAAVAGIVFVDALSVGAPGLALLGVPFLLAALRFRRATRWGSALVVAWCALYVIVGVNYAIGNGFDAGWGDLLFAYPGTVVAAVLGVVAARLGFVRLDRPET